MKGNAVTVSDVFSSLKGSRQTQQSVLKCNFIKALEKNIQTWKESAKKIDKAYKKLSFKEFQCRVNSHKYLQPMVKQKESYVLKSITQVG